MLKSRIRVFQVCCLLIVAAGLRPLWAQSERAFVVESVNAQLSEAVYFLNVVIAIHLPEHIERAVEQGFDLPLVMEIEVYRQKTMWFDKKIVLIKQQYRVSYHSLLDEYSILDVNLGARTYFTSLNKAMEQLSVLMDYPALDKNTLASGKVYSVRLRFGLDDAELPLPLKSSSLWREEWDIKSDWFDWELNP